MMQKLQATELNAGISLSDFSFQSTAELLDNSMAYQPDKHAWVAQSEAKKAAIFGLNMRQSGFNVLVLGAHGSGRKSLMQSAMLEVAKQANPSHNPCPLQDLVAVYHFDQPSQPTLIKLPVGCGAKLRLEMDQFARSLMAELPSFVVADKPQIVAEQWITQAVSGLTAAFSECDGALKRYFEMAQLEVLAYLKAWQPPTTDANETENVLEGLISEPFFARFRVNVLVDNRLTQTELLSQAVVYDNDPSLQSLFGTVESASESSQMPDFLRLRAGNLHKADGGMLLLHLRDLLGDETNGVQMIEKLFRFLRNGTLQIEDSSSTPSNNFSANTLIKLQVKLVLIATREDFYNCMDEQPDFFDYFPIKVEFAERVLATNENYAAIAGFVAQKCVQHNCPHFTSEAVAGLIGALQRLEEDQTRISTNFAFLERLILESAAFADVAQASPNLVEAAHVQAALQAKAARNQYF